MRVTVKINLYKLRKFADTLESDLRLSSSGPVREALHDWADYYNEFLKQRFEIFSNGGGSWKALSPRTLAAKARQGLLLLILRATDTLFNKLATSFSRKPGVVGEMQFGVRASFEGMDEVHHDSDKTVAEIGMFHQEGGLHLPQRKIIVPPDQQTVTRMRVRMKQALKEQAERAGYS